MSAEFEAKLQECIAKGFKESGKELDISLLGAINEEIMMMLDKELPETVVLAYESFTKGNTVTDLLDNLIVREGNRR